MNVEIGAEAALFPEKEYINRIAVAVQVISVLLNKKQPWIKWIFYSIVSICENKKYEWFLLVRTYIFSKSLPSVAKSKRFYVNTPYTPMFWKTPLLGYKSIHSPAQMFNLLPKFLYSKIRKFERTTPSLFSSRMKCYTIVSSQKMSQLCKYYAP